MSTSPYSNDLRSKVITYLKSGGKQISASKIFNLHRNTINRWWVRFQKEGIYTARRRPGAKRRLDLEELSLYMDTNNNIGLSEVSSHFNISKAWSSISLRKIGYSYKKNRLATWKLAKKNEKNI